VLSSVEASFGGQVGGQAAWEVLERIGHVERRIAYESVLCSPLWIVCSFFNLSRLSSLSYFASGVLFKKEKGKKRDILLFQLIR
jgi:hypothetical protein